MLINSVGVGVDPESTLEPPGAQVSSGKGLVRTLVQTSEGSQTTVHHNIFNNLHMYWGSSGLEMLMPGILGCEGIDQLRFRTGSYMEESELDTCCHVSK